MAEQAPRISAAPATRLPLPNELQEEIFDLLDTADLAKAAAACTSFRKIIVAPSFLRRLLRRLPPPRLLGFLEDEGHSTPCLHSFHHNSAPVARFVAGAADFALSFLPDHPNLWRIRDASDGRILLSHASRRPWDLVVCDPLHRSYVRVPQIPDHVAAGTRRPRLSWYAFLVPAGGEEEPPLQVVWMMHQGGEIIVFAFSSSTGEWRGVQFSDWHRDSNAHLSLSYRHYAHGCFYWTFWRLDTALMLDMREMNFSIFQLPRVSQGPRSVVVEHGEGNLGWLHLGYNGILLYSRTWQGNGVGAAADWNLTRAIPLPDDSLKYKIVGAADGYLLLQAFPKHFSPQQTPQARYFTLKLETLLIEELFVSLNKGVRNTHLYVNFPPPLALPSI
ncbi:unnamed protein product [Urochloa decumbens]|uniref:F-box domain-containing protein n=1 Tax=Urochloa decumbens TaxID=240449 RepID=A0ABC8VW87_9POAL